jgi:hypothetical protein
MTSLEETGGVDRKAKLCLHNHFDDNFNTCSNHKQQHHDYFQAKLCAFLFFPRGEVTLYH